MTFEVGELLGRWVPNPVIFVVVGTIAALCARWLQRRSRHPSRLLILGAWFVAGCSYFLAAVSLIGPRL